jgi:hypothetical protein
MCRLAMIDREPITVVQSDGLDQNVTGHIDLNREVEVQRRY